MAPSCHANADATLRGMNPLPDKHPLRCIAVVTLLTTLASAPSVAQTTQPDEAGTSTGGLPLWEAGAALGGGRFVDYPGADQGHLRGLVAPVFIYRGRILRVDQGGIRGRLLDTPDWEFDLSASAAFNARSNDARQGMPALDYLFGVGPQLIYKGLRGHPGSPTLHLKTRAVMSTDFRDVHGRGFTFDPELRWRMRPVAASPMDLTLSLQPSWASRSLQRYFYQVDTAQATAARPAYDARAGYLGTAVSLTLGGRRSGSLSWFANLRMLSLHGAANTDSPLLRDRSNVSAAAGVVWTPWKSELRAAD
jgi:MipA family protein